MSQGRANIYNADGLTKRELEVLRLVATGLTNTEVDAELNMAEGTVKFHMTSITKFFNASSRLEAVLTAMNRGVIPCACNSRKMPTVLIDGIEYVRKENP